MIIEDCQVKCVLQYIYWNNLSHCISAIRFKASLATNLADIMDKIGLSEIMQPSANYGKISEKPVKVDTMNHKVRLCHI